MINKDFLVEKAKAFGFSLSEKQVEQFSTYGQFLVEYNEKVNLTAITQPDEIVVKHFIDSLLLTRIIELEGGLSLADIGTGAGFPGVVLKIFNPNIQLTLVDSLRKRVDFLEQLNEKLGFKDTICVHSRAEDIGRNPLYREKFDIVTARAVANLAVLSEYCIPLVKIDGHFIPMKGSALSAEVEASQTAIKLLGGEIIKVKHYTLDFENDRGILLVKKISQTSTKYPRINGKIKKTPLK